MAAKQTKRKDSNSHSENSLSRMKNTKHHTSHMDHFEENDGFGPMEAEYQDLEQQDAEEMKDFGELVSKNSELRRKNKELCRLLHLSLIRQKDLGATQGNGDVFEELDSMSSETGETLEDQFWHVCGRSYSERKVGRRKKQKLNASEDLDKADETEREDAHKKDDGYGGKGKRISRKAKKGRQSSKTLSLSQSEKESSRQSHDHHSKTPNSEQKIHKVKLSNEEDEKKSKREEEIIPGNNEMETDATLPRDNRDHSSGESDSSISSASKHLELGEASLISADDEKYPEEEEANMTISTEDEDKQKVYDHIASVDEVTFCDKPRPVVIYPSDHYPVPKKYYTPQGTILHRCSKHSGCCPNEQLTCVPAIKETVFLHFFAAVLDGSGAIVPHIEKLRFVNHTKCGCVFKHRAHLYL